MNQPLVQLSNSFSASRLALHRVAAYVVSPARRRAMGRMGLRATPGGFGTPSFYGPDGMTMVGVDGVDLVVRSDSGLIKRPLSTLADAGALVGADPDVAWAADLDIPEPGDLQAPLAVDAGDAAALAAWFAFGWGILEDLSMDTASEQASEPQLWPEHFDPAIEIGDPETNRASYGFSPGDVAQDASVGPERLPYLYVAPWFADKAPASSYWSAGRLAILRYADLRADPDPAATARAFLVEGRSLLSNMPGESAEEGDDLRG